MTATSVPRPHATQMTFTHLTDAIALAGSLPPYYAASAGIEIRAAVLRGYLVGIRAALGAAEVAA